MVMEDKININKVCLKEPMLWLIVSLIESSFEIVLQFHKADISIQTKKTAEANFTCTMWYF